MQKGGVWGSWSYVANSHSWYVSNGKVNQAKGKDYRDLWGIAEDKWQFLQTSHS